MPESEILNEDLKLEQVPGADATWERIEQFALTFYGTARIGKRLPELAESHRLGGTVPQGLDELRGCLYFEQRKWRHFMSRPDTKALRHLRALIEGIRQEVQKGPSTVKNTV
jgi:hypothetical protein